MAQQLTFLPESKDDLQDIEIRKIKESQDKIRKSLYAENRNRDKQLQELQHEFEIFKMALCRSGIQLGVIK